MPFYFCEPFLQDLIWLTKFKYFRIHYFKKNYVHYSYLYDKFCVNRNAPRTNIPIV